MHLDNVELYKYREKQVQLSPKVDPKCVDMFEVCSTRCIVSLFANPGVFRGSYPDPVFFKTVRAGFYWRFDPGHLYPDPQPWIWQTIKLIFCIIGKKKSSSVSYPFNECIYLLLAFMFESCSGALTNTRKLVRTYHSYVKETRTNCR